MPLLRKGGPYIWKSGGPNAPRFKWSLSVFARPPPIYGGTVIAVLCEVAWRFFTAGATGQFEHVGGIGSANGRLATSTTRPAIIKRRRRAVVNAAFARSCGAGMALRTDGISPLAAVCLTRRA